MLFLVSTPGNGKGSGGTSDAQTAAAVAEITGLPSNTQINFATGDPLNFNQTWCKQPSQRSRPPTLRVPPLLSAVLMRSPISCRFHRRAAPCRRWTDAPVNGLNAVPVADNIINLQFSYDVINSTAAP